MTTAEQSSLIDEIVRGGNRQLQLLAARGLAPLPPADLIPLQVVLAQSADPTIAAAATNSVGEIEPKIMADVVDESLDYEVLAFLSAHVRHPVVVESILRLRTVAPQLLRELAPGLGAEQQEVLLLRQDVIVSEPSILEALEKNPELTAYSRRRIDEYRTHLLPREVVREERTAEDPVLDEVSEQEVQAAIEAALDTPAVGDKDELTGLSESQIRSLPVPVRLQLTRGASRSLRTLLIRDQNTIVALSVLRNNALADAEIEQIANNRTVCDEVLEVIGNTRVWVRKYPIMHALIKNPRAPLGMAVRLVSRLSVRDLRAMSRDRNVANAIRVTAGRLYKMRAN